jgi:predicted nucleic acid-binding Zn ribbon protein
MGSKRLKTIKKCQVCKVLFPARKDAKTCSAACRKQLQRWTHARVTQKAVLLESAAGQKFHRLAADLLKRHVVREPLILTDKEDDIMAVNMPQPAEKATPAMF